MLSTYTGIGFANKNSVESYCCMQEFTMYARDALGVLLEAAADSPLG